EMAGPKRDDRVDQGLHSFRDEGLQDVALNRQLETRERRHAGRIAGAGKTHLAGTNEPLDGVEAEHAAGLHADARHLAVLHQIDAALIRPARAAAPRPAASGAAAPPRRCSNPPAIGKRALSKSSEGMIARSISRSRSSASTPCNRMALPRRANASRWASEW